MPTIGLDDQQILTLPHRQCVLRFTRRSRETTTVPATPIRPESFHRARDRSHVAGGAPPARATSREHRRAPRRPRAPNDQASPSGCAADAKHGARLHLIHGRAWATCRKCQEQDAWPRSGPAPLVQPRALSGLPARAGPARAGAARRRRASNPASTLKGEPGGDWIGTRKASALHL